jgi:hypothetical protein
MSLYVVFDTEIKEGILDVLGKELVLLAVVGLGSLSRILDVYSHLESTKLCHLNHDK